MKRAYRVSDGGVLLQVRVTPNASTDICGGCWIGADGDKRLALKVTAPPDKGRANKAVQKLVASALGLPKSAVSLTAGEKDRLKTLLIEGDRVEIAERLAGLLGPEGDKQ